MLCCSKYACALIVVNTQLPVLKFLLLVWHIGISSCWWHQRDGISFLSDHQQRDPSFSAVSPSAAEVKKEKFLPSFCHHNIHSCDLPSCQFSPVPWLLSSWRGLAELFRWLIHICGFFSNFHLHYKKKSIYIVNQLGGRQSGRNLSPTANTWLGK